MRCLLWGHVEGKDFWYAGTGMVSEHCDRCGKFIRSIAVEDWEWSDLLLDYLAVK